MRQRRLPSTDLSLSEVGFGTWTVSSTRWGVRDQAEGIYLLRRALDLGVTYFETIDVLDEGEGERIIPLALEGHREDIVVGATVGYDWYTPAYLRPPEGSIPQKWDAAFIRKACESSLQRLNTDRIDLYQMHNPGLQALESEELFYTLQTLRREGKIRSFGAVFGRGRDWREAGEIALKERHASALQGVYNLVEQEPMRSLFPVAAKTEAGLIFRDPLADGLIDGTLVEPITRKHEVTPAQLALMFALSEPTAVSTLPDLVREPQMVELLAVPDRPPLAAEDLEALHDIFPAPSLEEDAPRERRA